MSIVDHSKVDKMVRTGNNKRKEVIKRLEALHTDSLKHGVSDEIFKDIFLGDCNANSDNKTEFKDRGKKSGRLQKRVTITVCLVAVLAAILAYVTDVKSLDDVRNTIEAWQCVISNNEIIAEMARPKFDCRICENVREVPIETDISPELFRERYAYTAVPVLVKGATKTWSAMETFSFQYFKDLYQNTHGALKSVEEECQFFPYKTEFDSLEEVFNMSEARANFEEGEKPWYIGWSNCHPQVQKKLREQYQRPYFLPNNSESSQLDWMFMGGSGPGAFIHIDFVQRPSWQAQIVGKKTWGLYPSPECEDVCHNMNVTVHKGDIFVVDTNKWFHSTFIHPGEISITIGSEYD